MGSAAAILHLLRWRGYRQTSGWANSCGPLNFLGLNIGSCSDLNTESFQEDDILGVQGHPLLRR